MVKGPAKAVDDPETPLRNTLPEDIFGTFHVPIPEFEALETAIFVHVTIESLLKDHWIELPMYEFHRMVVFPGTS